MPKRPALGGCVSSRYSLKVDPVEGALERGPPMPGAWAGSGYTVRTAVPTKGLPIQSSPYKIQHCMGWCTYKAGKVPPMQQPAAGRRLKKPNRTWVRPFAEGSGPLYLQIAQQVRDAVDDGVLQPGDRLPPQRDLAQLMGVDLTTVT